MGTKEFRIATVIALLALGCGGDRDAPEPELRPAPPPPPPVMEPVDTPAVQEVEAVAAPALETTRPLFTVQIGAFLSGEAASQLSEQLGRREIPARLMEVDVSGRHFHRVRVGALPGFGEARQLGARLANEFRQPVWIAPVGDDDRVPAGTIEATRALMRR